MNAFHSQTDSPPLLDIRGLSWRVGGTPLLKDLGFAIRPGESVGLLGPNGAGKSSLIRLLAGETQSTSGSVSIQGRLLADWDRRDLARIRAVMPQQQAVGFPLRVAEVVA